ncbi:MAG: DMT family transporter [Paracoccaceae bacterium]
MTAPGPTARPRLTGIAAGLSPVTRGAIGMAVTVLFFAAMDATARHLTQSLPTLQVAWARYTSQTVVLVVLFAPRLGTLARSVQPRLQLLRGVLLFATTLTVFEGLKHLELAEMSALLQLAPLGITALAALVLRERVGPRRWAAIGVGLCGALLVIRPGLEVFQPAALFGLAGALGYAAYQVTTRMLRPGDAIVTTLLYTTALGAAVSSLMVPSVWVPPGPELWAWMAAIGVIGLLGQMCLVWSLAQAPASALAPFNHVSLVWASGIGFLAFGEVPQALTLAGGAVIVGAALYVWHRERRREAGG